MKFGTLIRRSLRFHWRSHLGVVLGAAIGGAALIGALVVGDSVKESLRERALARLGWVDVMMVSGDRFFSADVAKHYTVSASQPEEGKGRSSALLYLPATITRSDAEARINAVNVFGIDANFGPSNSALAKIPPNSVVLNHTLADQLKVSIGDEVIIRVRKPSALSLDTPLSSKNDASIAMRLNVSAIVGANDMGDFAVAGSQRPAANIFLPIDELAQRTGLTNKANVLVAGELRRFALADVTGGSAWRIWLHLLKAKLTGKDLIWGKSSVEQSLTQANEGLRDVTSLSTWGITLTNAVSPVGIEIRSDRIFLEPALVRAVNDTNLNVWSRAQPAPDYADQIESILKARAELTTNHLEILTYLATLLQAGTNATPYSMVTAAGAPWTPADLRDDEIVVSRWLADDLHVKPGDQIAMSYFLPESGAKLTEATNTFRVRSIAPVEMPWADRTLMPDFPGIENAESTSEWDAGFPLTYKIRPQDEDYWKKYRGTPKAFVTLAAGQKMWGNRFGNLTAIRFPADASNVDFSKDALEKKILANLNPEDLGLRFEPVREQALKAAAQSQDFGGLFLGFSFFLIIAALLLMAMLFQFGLEQRAPEIGTLLALGFTVKQVRKLLMREGIALAFIGGIIGTIGGIYFAKTMLHALTTIWRDAVGATALSFHYTTQTLAIGLLSSVIVSAITIWLALRKFVKRPARELLAGDIASNESRVLGVRYKVLAIASLVTAIGLVGWALAKRETANAEVFFSAGSLILIAGLGFASAWLARKSNAAPSGARITEPSLGSLALRGCARRRKRSLATIAMLACGSFLIVSIGVFRLDANIDATKKTSGTGGFALLGETTMPVVQDLNSKAGRDFFALNESDLKDVHFVPFRVRAGDEASCLNLNAAQKPRLLGVNPEMMAGRFSFAKGTEWKSLALTSTKALSPSSPQPSPPLRGREGEDSRARAVQDNNARSGSETARPLTPALSPDGGEGGSARDAQRGDDTRPAVVEIPAIGDANSIQWAMHKKIGDTIDYVDERGQPFKVRIIGAVANSILQGQLIIDEAEFVKRFPGESGYRMFLIDAPSNAVSQVSATLSRAMQDVGLELTPTVQRLAQFNAVQNTYLGTFQVLGGLGLLLGSVGLGIVVLRNVLERRGELAVMIALGFRKGTVQSLLLMENGALLLAGLAIGVIAAAVAVLPAVLSPTAQLPYGSLAVTLAAVLVNGALWTWAATKLAVRGDLLKALRNE